MSQQPERIHKKFHIDRTLMILLLMMTCIRYWRFTALIRSWPPPAGHAFMAEAGDVVCDRISDAGLSDAFWRRSTSFTGVKIFTGF